MQLVDELLPNMRRVMAADRDLRELSLLWAMIESSSAIGCPEDAESILPTLFSTRVHFAELQARLVQQLGAENLAELGDELSATAQCSIDILVRNLFERTADVGFLATDDVLRGFCAAGAQERGDQHAAMLARLAEYRAKYTVYDDIIVLGLDGAVLARLDAASGLEHSSEPALASALARDGYVERYGSSDLAADGAAALLYAHRITDANGRKLGVLVLRFRFADELECIFSSVLRTQRPMAVLLIDDKGKVVVSNDVAHVPLGAKLSPGPDGKIVLSVFAGREYLTLTCPTRGYQGYQGPGWRAMAMVSVSVAFRAREDNEEAVDGVALENEVLRQVQGEVDGINRNLRRVVWNGRLMTDTRHGGRAQLKAILQQVNDAGARMRDRAGLAIRDLYQTALGRAKQQAQELARLAADIMDRNLYERANDCRWWALSPVLRQVLAQGVDAAGTQRINAVLGHINGLYTVYSRLVVFDAQGIICGVSQDNEQASLLGTQVADSWLAGVRGLTDSQRYMVSGFEASALSDGQPTYVYCAAVRAPASPGASTSPGAVVGGIAIVFNSQREFRAMLDDVLDGRQGLAAFIGAKGDVIACTDPRCAPGQKLPFAPDQPIIEHDGSNFAVFAFAAPGYREFKVSDGYDNGVRSVIALRLGKVERRRASISDFPIRALPYGPQRRLQELAFFQAGSGRYALPVSAVLEARPPKGIVRMQRAGAHMAGLLEVDHGRDRVVVPVLCARTMMGLNYAPRAGDGVVVVLEDPDVAGQPLLGLRVDDVASVLDVDESHVQPTGNGLRGHAPLILATVRLQPAGERGGETLAQLMDVDALVRYVRPQHVGGPKALQPAASVSVQTTSTVAWA